MTLRLSRASTAQAQPDTRTQQDTALPSTSTCLSPREFHCVPGTQVAACEWGTHGTSGLQGTDDVSYMSGQVMHPNGGEIVES